MACTACFLIEPGTTCQGVAQLNPWLSLPMSVINQDNAPQIPLKADLKGGILHLPSPLPKCVEETLAITATYGLSNHVRSPGNIQSGPLVSAIGGSYLSIVFFL